MSENSLQGVATGVLPATWMSTSHLGGHRGSKHKRGSYVYLLDRACIINSSFFLPRCIQLNLPIYFGHFITLLRKITASDSVEISESTRGAPTTTQAALLMIFNRVRYHISDPTREVSVRVLCYSYLFAGPQIFMNFNLKVQTKCAVVLVMCKADVRLDLDEGITPLALILGERFVVGILFLGRAKSAESLKKSSTESKSAERLMRTQLEFSINRQCKQVRPKSCQGFVFSACISWRCS